MHAHRSRTTTSLVLLAVVFLAIGGVSTIDRIPAAGELHAQTSRSEAHDSGLCAADLATRRRFATDLLHLTLAGPRMNRYEKVDRDAAEWLPAQNHCWFAARVICRPAAIRSDHRPSRGGRAGRGRC